jgi:hypothetical protein
MLGRRRRSSGAFGVVPALSNLFTNRPRPVRAPEECTPGGEPPMLSLDLIHPAFRGDHTQGFRELLQRLFRTQA